MEPIFNFSSALSFLKEGKKVARTGWNGENMYLEYVDPYDNKLFEIREKEIQGTLYPWIGMQTAQNTFIPWLASQSDLLSDDWVLV